jgi:hypothetical protein
MCTKPIRGGDRGGDALRDIHGHVVIIINKYKQIVESLYEDNLNKRMQKPRSNMLEDKGNWEFGGDVYTIPLAGK